MSLFALLLLAGPLGAADVTAAIDALAADDATREEMACRLNEGVDASVGLDDARALTVSLLAVLKDGTTGARVCAAVSLGKIAPAIVDPSLSRRLKDEAVPMLVLGLDQRGEMCRAAADALGSLGPIASDAVPRLEDAVERESCARQSLHAETALQRIRSGG